MIMATDQHAVQAVKRVMSNDCNADEREEKKSKTNFDGDDGGAAERMGSLALGGVAEGGPPPPPAPAPAAPNDAGFPKLDVPVASISHGSHASETHSSLSDEAGDGTAARLGPGPASGGSDPASAAAASPPKGMEARAVSDDESSEGRSSLPSSATSEGNRGSLGNWGWFEDPVQPHEGGFLPDVGSSAALKEGAKGEGSKKKKKKGGLLHIGSELMQNVFQPLLEPNRQGEGGLIFRHGWAFFIGCCCCLAASCYFRPCLLQFLLF